MQTFKHCRGGDDCWFGLAKATSTVDGTTSWVDGNPSTYRNWDTANGEPNQAEKCIYYTADGSFRDGSCWFLKLKYTCKEPMTGN
jgi:hypothetical protein